PGRKGARRDRALVVGAAAAAPVAGPTPFGVDGNAASRGGWASRIGGGMGIGVPGRARNGLAGTVRARRGGGAAGGAVLGRAAPVVRRGRSLGAALAWGVVSHAVDAAAIAICFFALGLRLPPAAPLLVLLAVSLVLALPTAPAGVGSLEVGAVAALRLLGVD